MLEMSSCAPKHLPYHTTPTSMYGFTSRFLVKEPPQIPPTSHPQPHTHGFICARLTR